MEERRREGQSAVGSLSGDVSAVFRTVTDTPTMHPAADVSDFLHDTAQPPHSARAAKD
jgi:hypothetical protein